MRCKFLCLCFLFIFCHFGYGTIDEYKKVASCINFTEIFCDNFVEEFEDLTINDLRIFEFGINQFLASVNLYGGEGSALSLIVATFWMYLYKKGLITESKNLKDFIIYNLYLSKRHQNEQAFLELLLYVYD